MTTHRTDICTGNASRKQLALPDGGSVTFWNRACCLVAGRKSCLPTDSPFFFLSFSCLCVPQSFRAASFIYNLFVLAVVCQCFFPLPSAHEFLTSISDSLPKLPCTAHSFLSCSLSFFMQNKQHLLQTALHY